MGSYPLHGIGIVEIQELSPTQIGENAIYLPHRGPPSAGRHGVACAVAQPVKGEPNLLEEMRRNCLRQAREGGTALRAQSAVELSGRERVNRGLLAPGCPA